jgi:hypothetical protein
MKGKYKVKDQFRTNDLSKVETSISAEVHVPGENIKMYSNIHYPNGFACRTFKNNPSVSHITFKDTSESREWTIKKENDN